MRCISSSLAVGIATASLALITAGVVVHAQQGTTQPKPATTTKSAPKPATQTVEQQRAAIWNSPEMLRARAWVADYTKNSKNMSPEEAKEYMTELANLSPKQMKLWLLQYEHQQQLYLQKESAKQVAHRAAMSHASAMTPPSPEAMKMWQMQHQAGLAQAMAADKATQQSYNAINREETAAAGEAQSQLNAEQAMARQMQESKQDELNNPYPYGYGGWGGYGYGGYGGVHFHFH